MNDCVRNITIDAGSHHPKYRQLAEGIRRMIDTGLLPPGERLPTSKAIQESLDLSLVTVENALTRLVKQNYLIRRQRIGTFVNPAFKPRISPSSRHFGEELVGKSVKVLFCDIELNDLYWYHVLGKIEELVTDSGGNLTFTRTTSKDISETGYAPLENIDGIVACGYVSLEVVDFYNKRGVPLAVVGNLESNTRRDDVHIVAHDDEHRAYISTKHLLDLGHREIALVVGPKDSALEKDFSLGYEKAMNQYEIPNTHHVIAHVDEHTFQAGVGVADSLLLTPPRPTAVFACDDRLASGIMKRAASLGLVVPNDLSVLGCGNLEIAEVTTPALTTTESFPEKSADMAVEMIRGQILGKKNVPNKRFVLRIDKVLLRESTIFKTDN